LFGKIIDIAVWSEGGIPLDTLKHMPINELIFTIEKCVKIQEETDRKLAKMKR